MAVICTYTPWNCCINKEQFQNKNLGIKITRQAVHDFRAMILREQPVLLPPNVQKLALGRDYYANREKLGQMCRKNRNRRRRLCTF